jgi:hypothetical protein
MLEYFTTDSNVMVEFKKTKAGQEVMQIKKDKKKVAVFDLCMVWDQLVDRFSSFKRSKHPGIRRRSYEAANITRLTDEYIKKYLL